ncbi:MAG: transposase [Acidobacteriota bacterium]
MAKPQQTQTISIAEIETLIKKAESGLLSVADAPLANKLALMVMRGDDLTEFILMADAKSKNWSKKFSYIVAKCLAHGRRKFVDCKPAFRTECGIILDKLGEVYKIDAQTKDMKPLARLDYHQTHSKPIFAHIGKKLIRSLPNEGTQK